MLADRKNADRRESKAGRHRGLRSPNWWGIVFSASLALIAVLAAIAQNGQAPGTALPTDNLVSSTASIQPSEANAQLELRDRPTPQGAVEDASAQRRRQMVDDSGRLLALAIALKTDVDKSSKDTLSVSVVRRADQIEKLAREVKQRIKVGVGKG